VKKRNHELKPVLYAGLSLLIITSATSSWFTGEHKNLPTAGKQALLDVARVFRDESVTPSHVRALSDDKASSFVMPKKSRSAKK
jgi:hypothetical protein